MFCQIIIVACLGGLGACAVGPNIPRERAPGATARWPVPTASARPFSFEWRLSGDPAVAPLRVFDDGSETWLHFDRDARLPAILGVDGEGKRALPYERRAPYVVLPGVWSELRFRGGALQAVARRGPGKDDALAGAFPSAGEPGGKE